MDGDSSEDDCNFTTVFYENKGVCLAHLERKKSVRCAFLRFRRMRPDAFFITPKHINTTFV